jgi:DNA-binding XRE family transcriptional regulator
MITLLDPKQPTLDDIFGARFNAKLTQQQAADLIGYSRRGWQDAENGKNKLHPAAWALFLLATWQHPSHQVINSKDSK